MPCRAEVTENFLSQLHEEFSYKQPHSDLPVTHNLGAAALVLGAGRSSGTPITACRLNYPEIVACRPTSIRTPHENVVFVLLRRKPLVLAKYPSPNSARFLSDRGLTSFTQSRVSISNTSLDSIGRDTNGGNTNDPSCRCLHGHRGHLRRTQRY